MGNRRNEVEKLREQQKQLIEQQELDYKNSAKHKHFQRVKAKEIVSIQDQNMIFQQVDRDKASKILMKVPQGADFNKYNPK